MAATDATVTVSAQNQFSDWVKSDGPVAIQIDIGTLAGTITLQASLDGGTTASDVNSWTASFFGLDGPGAQGAGITMHYRIGCKTGGYSSGTSGTIRLRTSN